MIIKLLAKFRALGIRLECVHVVPGDARNKLVEEIVNSELVTYGVVAIYAKDQSMQETCSRLGIEFYSLGFKEKRLFLQFVSLLLYVLRSRPKSVYLHSFYPSLIGVGLVLLCPFTKIISVRHHNMVHLLSRNRKGSFLDRVIAKMSFRTIAVSHAVKETMLTQGSKPEKIFVIHNGIRLSESIHRKILPPSSPLKMRLIAVGRLDWQKNYETMLRVGAELKNRHIDFNLTILGSGNENYSTSLFEISKSLEIDDRVRWLGWQANIEEWFAESDIFLHTALDEACPLVLIEALMAGLPVVTSNAGGSAEVIAGFATGCSANEVGAYADQIVSTWRIIREFRQRAKDQIPLVEEKFGVARMRRAYEISILSILN